MKIFNLESEFLMPIEGRFYTYPELIEILGRMSRNGRVSKQYVNKIARQQQWRQPAPGLFHADSVEKWLEERDISIPSAARR